MQRSTFRLSLPLQAVVYLSFAVLLATGAGWMVAQGRLEEEAWETIPRLLLNIHGGAAMAVLLVLGALTLHVKRGWKAGRNRLSGVLLLAVNGFLIGTGYALYYAGGEELRAWCSHWHAWIGLGLGALLPGHIIAGRLIMRAAHRARHPEHPSRTAGS